LTLKLHDMNKMPSSTNQIEQTSMVKLLLLHLLPSIIMFIFSQKIKKFWKFEFATLHLQCTNKVIHINVVYLKKKNVDSGQKI